MSRLKIAVFYSNLTQQSSLIVSFVSIMIIARHITPSEIGVYAVASAFTVIATELRAFGVNQYLVREEVLNNEKKETAYGVMLAISWMLGAIIIAASNKISLFYDEPNLKNVICIISITFFIAPFATIPFSMLIRNMQFEIIFKIRLGSSLASGISAVALVLLGFSYFGLAYSVVLGALAELLLITYYDKSKSISWPRLTLWKEVLIFGLATSGSGLLQKLAQSAPEIVLGKLNSMTDVGIFSRGTGLVMFIDRFLSNAIGRIILPHLSEVKRARGDFNREYLKCIHFHGAVAIPAFAVSAVLAHPLIIMFFGKQWTAAAPIASILSVWAILKTVHSFLPSALVAAGHENKLIVKELIVTCTRFTLVVSFASFGLQIIALAICISGLLELMICSYFSSKYLNLPSRDLFRSISANVLIAFLCWLMAYTIYSYTQESTHPALVIFYVGTTVSVVWVVSLITTKHPIWLIIKNISKSTNNG